MLSSHPGISKYPWVTAWRSCQDRSLQCDWFPLWLLQRSFHWNVEVELHKLQRVQNTLVRVVLRQRKYEHITPAFKELHWLPVQHRVTFKTAYLFNKKTGEPAYLLDLVLDSESVRTLRSSSKNLISKCSLSTILAFRGLKHSAASVWNNLPDNIRDSKTWNTFKRKLRTHLCKSAFGS